MTSIVYPTTNLRHVEQLNIVRGEGVYVYDDSGKEYLEGDRKSTRLNSSHQ